MKMERGSAASVPRRLEAEGFVRRRDEEPDDDCWVLERPRPRCDVLVEFRDDGWAVLRSPEAHERQAEWIEATKGVGEEACLAAVSRLLRPDPANPG
jgi:hypothetical protein